MTFKIACSALFLCSVCAFGAESTKPFAIVDLKGATPRGAACLSTWPTWAEEMFWVDDDHLAVSLLCSYRKQPDQEEKELLIIDTNQKVVMIKIDRKFMTTRGHIGTVLLRREHDVEVLDSNLQIVQTLNCPSQQERCYVVLPPSASQSDFAICSIAKTLNTCTFYGGRPATAVKTVQPAGGLTKAPYEEPLIPKNVDGVFTHGLVPVTQNETWFFTVDQSLMAVSRDGVIEPVSKKNWVPNESYCRGQVSEAEPRRFLAICTGAYIYTDYALDNIFGYSRIALFDVLARRIIARFDGRSYIRASLSPSGRLVAVAHGESIQMYRIP